MRARLEAVWKKDVVTWSRLTAEEFSVVVPEGSLQTKAERLAAMKSEKPQPVHAVQHEQMQRYGETVLHRFVDDGEWILEVWVRQNGAWRVVAAQVNVANNDRPVEPVGAQDAAVPVARAGGTSPAESTVTLVSGRDRAFLKRFAVALTRE
jgi:hypothetical protein